MTRSAAPLALAGCWILGLAVLLAPSTARSTTVDCGDFINQLACTECNTEGTDDCISCLVTDCEPGGCTIDNDCACENCGGDCDVGSIDCCSDPDDCEILAPPPPGPPEVARLGLTLTVGPDTVVFQRKGTTKNKQTFVTFKLKTVTVSSVTRKTLTLTGVLTGADAAVGSLLYPVAFLAGGPTTLSVLQGHGYAVSLAGAPPAQTCQSLSSPELCNLLSDRLARLLDAALTASGDVESRAFEAGTQALGLASCQAPGTTTTTTSSSTTSSTKPPCVPQNGACTADTDCCNAPPFYCDLSGGPGTGFCNVIP